MHPFARLTAGALVAIAVGVAAPVAAQQSPQPLAIGNEIALYLRTGDRLNGKDWTINDRISHVHDITARYLGGRGHRLTTRRWGDRVHIYVNGEFVLAATPADARAGGYLSLIHI